MNEHRPPEQGRRCFDQLPATLERVLTGTTAGPARDDPLLHERHTRVALIYLDAFGWRFLERQGDHSLLRRARSEGLVTQLTAQFPSTTTAHVTTIHTGLPVAEHGLYEWFVLEPSLRRIISPLLFAHAGDGRRETLAGILDAEDLYPRGPFYARLAEAGVRCSAAQPRSIAGSSPNGALLRDTEVLPFTTTEEGLAAAAGALGAAEAAYSLVYLHDVDALMHLRGPDDPAVDRAFAAALTAVEQAPFPPGTLVLVTADHGMSPVDPARTIYVNELWPELPALLKLGADGRPLAPAGSCRDLFLHVRPGRVDKVRDGLAERLEGAAEVVTVDRLIADGIFSEPAPRLSERLGDVVVLPRYGEAVYWHEPGRFVQHLHGQHGGLSAAEMEIPLVAWVA
jgi:Type I phosphodiesterase / nucleotide pyrophosphatase